MNVFRLSAFVLLLSALASCSRSNPAPVADINQGAAISGLISVAPELRSQLLPTDVLFVIARKDVGPPLAVKKIPSPSFPVAYALTAEDVMFPGTPFQGEVRLIVRVDRDGNAGPPQPGDLEGTAVKVPARVGDRDVDILIDRVL